MKRYFGSEPIEIAVSALFGVLAIVAILAMIFSAALRPWIIGIGLLLLIVPEIPNEIRAFKKWTERNDVDNSEII